MTAFDFDLFTIGAGSGGVRASRVAAAHGARVAVAENRYLGGTCVNVGCVPKKLLVYAAQYAEAWCEAPAFGWSGGTPAFDWQRLIANKNAEIERLNRVYRGLLTDSGVTIIEGRARLIDAHTVAVGERRLTARHVLIATGGWPVVPSFPGAEHVITSNEAFFLDRLPERIVILGGGYIAVEFAGIFHGLGARVTQLYRGPLFLRGFDDDIRHTLAEEMIRAGIDLRFRTNIRALARTADGLAVTLDDGSTLQADSVMAATGRAPLTADLGLEAAGVTLDGNGAVVVDADQRTSVATIYAVGDCTNRLNLTPVAIREGHALADSLFGPKAARADHEGVPTAVFSQPPAATVGLTEAAARERFADVRIFRTTFRPMKQQMVGGQGRTMMKLVVDAATDRVVGAHMVGADAPEIIQGIAIALKCGATKADFDATVGIHPTAAEEFVTLRTPVAASPAA
ncbi:MAG: glutathione-disulfide reductase [Defluviicoccus sp.]|nr:glutathione-disulfide reductase [Defluviicoccus sp.]MDG4592076.1 glutathione-disulfide reductase [Defluviicoccus sp.]